MNLFHRVCIAYQTMLMIRTKLCYWLESNYMLLLVAGCLFNYNCICIYSIASCMFSVESHQSKLKQFWDILKIPGCSLMIVYCAVVRAVGTGRSTGLSGWITSQVRLRKIFIQKYWYIIWSQWILRHFRWWMCMQLIVTSESLNENVI